MDVSNFNLRVYGLLIEEGKVLVSHESRDGFLMTKFPGGGLEKGEGLANCVIREFEEELGIKVSIIDHFYVNDFLQISAFKKKDQLISFYYTVVTNDLNKIIIHDKAKLDFEDQTFEWIELTDLNADQFTFPIDKIVAKKLALI